MSASLVRLISDFYKIKNNTMDLEKYNKLLRLYNGIRINKNKYVNMEEWNSIYIYNKNNIPETPPSKIIISNMIKDMLNINYIDLIYDFYKLLDNTTNLKQISKNIVKELEFMIFILSKQPNVSFKIDNKLWQIMRNKCLSGRNKTKMPRETITLQDIIYQINSIITLN
jgi:hypothetical protein